VLEARKVKTLIEKLRKMLWTAASGDLSALGDSNKLHHVVTRLYVADIRNGFRVSSAKMPFEINWV